jgi:hypothetical protein
MIGRGGWENYDMDFVGVEIMFAAMGTACWATWKFGANQVQLFSLHSESDLVADK